MIRKIKNNSFFIVSILLVIVLVACSNSEAGSSTDENRTESTENSSENSNNNDVANDFPNKEINLIISNAPGGSNDLAARTIAPYVEEELGVPVVVQNMEGAGGNIARAEVFNAEPDGYTLLKTPMPSLAIGELVRDGDFHTLDFEPVFNAYGFNSTTIIVPADSPIETLDDLIEISQQERLTVAGTGAATNSALASIIMKEAGIEHEYVAYDGDAEAASQVAGGHTDLGLVSESGAQNAGEGTIRVIGYLGEEPSNSFPDAETLVDKGFEDSYFEIMYSFWAPPGTPEEVVKILSDAFYAASQNEEHQEAAENAGFTLKPLRYDEYRSVVEESYQRIEQLKDKFEIED